MRVTINLPYTNFRHLHIILFIAAMLLELSLQSDVSGYICNDRIVGYEEAQKVAHYASQFITSGNHHFKYPALLEDTRLFGIENRNLFMMPLKTQESIRSGGMYHNSPCSIFQSLWLINIAGSLGSDRIVLDHQGTLMGVLVDLNHEARLVPSYERCTAFLTHDKISSGLDVDNRYKPSGFMCGSNFLSTEIEIEMKRKCSGLKNLFPNNKDLFQSLKREGINWSDNKFWYEFVTNKDYNTRNTRQTASYQVVFTSQCRLIRIKQVARGAFPRPTCTEIWAPKPSADIISVNPPLNLQYHNQQTSEKYCCRDVKFRITNLRNYLTEFNNLLRTTSRTSTGGFLIRHDKNVNLWPIFSPERLGNSIKTRSIFAMGFDEEENFLGMYYVFATTRPRMRYTLCPNPDFLKSLLVDRIPTDTDGRTRIFFS